MFLSAGWNITFTAAFSHCQDQTNLMKLTRLWENYFMHSCTKHQLTSVLLYTITQTKSRETDIEVDKNGVILTLIVVLFWVMWCCFAGSESWETDTEDNRNGDHLWLGPEDDWIADKGKSSGWVRNGDSKQCITQSVCVWERVYVCVFAASDFPETHYTYRSLLYLKLQDIYPKYHVHTHIYIYMHIHAHIHTHLCIHTQHTHTHFTSTWCDPETWWQLTKP